MRKCFLTRQKYQQKLYAEVKLWLNTVQAYVAVVNFLTLALKKLHWYIVCFSTLLVNNTEKQCLLL